MHVLLLILIACSPDSERLGLNAIYGQDERREVQGGATADRWDRAAAAVGVQIDQRLLRCEENGRCSILSASLEASSREQGRPLCPEVSYREQPFPGSCSGFLFHDARHYATAGHCILDQKDCEGLRFVFAYNASQSLRGDSAHSIAASRVIRCRRLKVRHFSGDDSAADFAVVELDRAVDVPPLPESSAELVEGVPLVMIGHPLGLPAKIAEGGKVRAVGADFFVASLDAFAVNSGSPVFNGITGEVEGILARGEVDFEWDPARGCRAFKKCPTDGCRGEDVTRIRALPNFSAESARASKPDDAN